MSMLLKVVCGNFCISLQVSLFNTLGVPPPSLLRDQFQDVVEKLFFMIECLSCVYRKW